jgi:hypothetical protein
MVSVQLSNFPERMSQVASTGKRHAQDSYQVLGMIAEPYRNRRVSTTLSPILYLFLAPSGKLYLKVQDVLAHDEAHDVSPPPIVGKRRPGPRHPKYGIPAEHWPLIMHRVVEQKEPLRSIAAAYGVSHEPIRRLLHRHQQPGQQEA